MSRYEFAIPKASVGDTPRVLIWEDGDLVRIAVSSADEALQISPKPVAIAEPSSGVIGQSSGVAQPQTAPATLALAHGSWTSGGVSLPPGTELSFHYDDEGYYGIVDNSEMVFDEARSKSPSGAVMAAIRDRTGKVVNVNGWNYIDVTLPGESDTISLGSLRSSVLKRSR